jgi:hypothetical protein
MKYQPLIASIYSPISPFEYPINECNKHIEFTNNDFIEKAKELYDKSSLESVRNLAYVLSYQINDGLVLTSGQIGLFNNSYKRYKKGIENEKSI